MKNVLTFGLTHLSLTVKDIAASCVFYQQIFDMEIMYRQDGFVQLSTPGSQDILVLEERENNLTGKTGGIVHFGFRLKDPRSIDIMKEKIRAAGGEITESGEFVAGEPFVFFKDPDGYVIEVWYEKL